MFSAKVSPKSTLSEHPALYLVVVPASVAIGGKSSSSGVSQVHEDNTPCPHPFATVYAITATDRACTNAVSMLQRQKKEKNLNYSLMFNTSSKIDWLLHTTDQCTTFIVVH